MKKITYKFSTTSTDFYFDSNFNQVEPLVRAKNTVFITDENAFSLHQKKFKNLNLIVINAGEAFKIQATIDSIIEQLIQFKANRTTTLIGVGGGVVTDITGFVASVFMRGIDFAFMPTTILGLVDASIGGKNGIDVGVYKNVVGTINQPKFILHDLSFLKTLPDAEWQNGFAEIIKHACIGNRKMFNELTENTIEKIKKNKDKLNIIIENNAKQKLKIVANDEFEKGDRKLLNFGHTLGHAIENTYKLSHGQAISIGMIFACKLSENILGFKQTNEVISLLNQYGLPTKFKLNSKKVFDVLVMDKKREEDFVHFILLEKIGKAVIKKVKLHTLKNALIQF